MSVIHITKENFEEEVLSSPKTVLLDFWAPWCGPCKMLSPVIDELGEEVGENIKVCKINVDEQKDLAKQYRVMSIPTLIVMKNGEVLKSSAGAKPKEDILAMLEV